MAVQIRYDRAPYAGRQPAESFGGRLLAVTGVLIGDNNYPTGGWSVDFSDLFPSRTHELVAVNFFPTGGIFFEYDKQNGKVKAYSQGTELSGGSAALDGVAIQFIAWGY